MASRFLHLVFLFIFTIALTRACSPADPCPSRFQCCLLIYNFRGISVRSKCVLPAFWYRARCAKGSTYCARNTDCNSNKICTGGSLRRWGKCVDGGDSENPC